MRAAICISGEMRCYRHPVVLENFFANFFNEINPDIYISAWDHTGKSEHTNFHIDDEVVDEALLLSIYPNVKGIKIENFNDWLSSQSIHHQNLWNNHRIDGVTRCTSIPQIYKMHDAFNLIGREEYDVVFRYRPDLIMLEKFELDSRFPNSLIHINTPRFYWPNRIYDVFYYSSQKIMSKISCAWESYDELVDSELFRDARSIYDATRLLYVHAINQNIPVQSLDRNICDVYRYESFDDLYKFFLG